MSEQRPGTAQGRANPLPATLENVTADWLTSALGARFPGVVVRRVTTLQVQQCFATNVRLRLEYERTGHSARPPETLFLKAGFGRDLLSPLFASAYAREVVFYRSIADLLLVNRPACYFAATDESGQSVLLLEDLLARGATIGSPMSPLSPEAAGSGLRQLARLHALWWESPALSRLEPYPGVLRPIVRQLLSGESWRRSIDRPSARWIPGRLRDAAVMRTAVEAAWRHNEQRPHCLLHGDAHVGNMFIDRDGDIGFIDWQAVSRGSWAYDVTRFLVGGLDVEDRRAHERSLLAGYLDALKHVGARPPTWDAAWLEYRRNTVHGLRWITSPPGNYAEDYIGAYARRFGTAVDDLDALPALDLA